MYLVWNHLWLQTCNLSYLEMRIVYLCNLFSKGNYVMENKNFKKVYSWNNDINIYCFCFDCVSAVSRLVNSVSTIQWCSDYIETNAASKKERGNSQSKSKNERKFKMFQNSYKLVLKYIFLLIFTFFLILDFSNLILNILFCSNNWKNKLCKLKAF